MVKKPHILSVRMNGILIGQLEKGIKGDLAFTYDQSWITTPGARPISLSLPLIGQRFVGDVVYNFFDNLLPDNQLIRARIQATFQVSTNHPFDLLACIGRDCVGAIQIIDKEFSQFSKKIKVKFLDETGIAHILRSYQDYPLGMRDGVDEFRISIAGAQEKTALLRHKSKWGIPLEETPTSHIFKLPIGFISHQQMDLSDSCENEWLCLQIAKEFGLAVAQSEIIYFEDVKVLVVERFERKLSKDKKWIMRLPQEDMCQALGMSSNLKYQADGGPGIKEIMQLLLGSADPTNDRDNFYRSQVLFWLLSAIDGHAKNFSVFLQAEGKYCLTPLYDVMSAYPLMLKKQLQPKRVKMAMALRGKNNHYHWCNVRYRHFLEAAKNSYYSIQKAQEILDEILEKVECVIEKVQDEIPRTFPNHISQPIFEGMRSMRDRLRLSDE